MPRCLSVFCFAAFLASLAVSEERTDQLVFRVGTRLVQVDVLVKDKNGHSVVGFSKDDFTLLDNGKPRSIEFFSLRLADRPILKPMPLPHGAVSNRLDDRDHEPIPATVILFDNSNTDFEDQVFARSQAMKYLQNMSDTEQIAIYGLGQGLNVVQEFTNDKFQLLNSLKRYQPEVSMDLTSADLVSNLLPTGDGGTDVMIRNAGASMLDNARKRRAERTMGAFEVIARHLSGMPGRKKLIWISASLPMIFSEQRERNGRQSTERQDFVSDFDSAARFLNSANIAIYPIDPRAVKPGVGIMDPNLDLMIRLAANTGGKAIFGNNDLSGAIQDVFLDADATYILGFYALEKDLDGMFHNLSVKVAKGGVEVRHRKGYLASQRQTIGTRESRENLTAWVRDPLEATEIRISAVASPVGNTPGFYRVEVTVDPSGLHLEYKNARWLGSFSLAIVPEAPAKPKGLLQTIRLKLSDDRLRTAMASGFVVGNTVQVLGRNGKPVGSKLHIVVQDGSSTAAGSVRLCITGECSQPPH